MGYRIKSQKPKEKIGIALSGGIDSIIAGWILKQEGYDLTGIYLYILEEDGIFNAQRAADFLGISLKILDIRRDFYLQIVQPFINAYISGETPNPCISCNSLIKCGLLLDWAIEKGLNYISTGHYAGIRKDNNTKKYLLVRGSDPRKDQSYFLYRLTQRQLSHLIFPLHNWQKRAVIDLAGKIGIDREYIKESQQICFLPSNNYRLFLTNKAPDTFRPGPVYDRFGNQVGTHSGLPGYTIGQRKSLHLKYPGPNYVLDIDSENNSIIIGKEKDLWGTELVVNQINRIIQPWPKKIMAQIRSTQPPQEAEILDMQDGRIRVIFTKPVKAITPGQSAVFFKGEICLGGGIIQKNK